MQLGLALSPYSVQKRGGSSTPPPQPSPGWIVQGSLIIQMPNEPPPYIMRGTIAES